MLNLRNKFFAAIIFLAFTVFSFWFVADKYAIKRMEGLTKWGGSIMANIVKLDCSNHLRITYQYSVKGIFYSGITSAETLKKECPTIKLGDQIKITFDSMDPSISSAGDVINEVAGQRKFIALVAIFGFFLGLNFARKKYYSIS